MTTRNKLALAKISPIVFGVVALMLVLATSAQAVNRHATVTLKSGTGWIEPFDGSARKDLAENVVTPVHPDDVVVCGPTGRLVVDLGLGPFELVKPCTFRIPSAKPSPSVKQEEMAQATTTAGRSRTGSVQWTSPRNASIVSLKTLALTWTPAAYMGLATITVSIGRAHPIWEQDNVDTKLGTLDSPLLRELLTMESRSGYTGPFLITIDCGKSGTAQSVFYVPKAR